MCIVFSSRLRSLSISLSVVSVEGCYGNSRIINNYLSRNIYFPNVIYYIIINIFYYSFSLSFTFLLVYFYITIICFYFCFIFLCFVWNFILLIQLFFYFEIIIFYFFLTYIYVKVSTVCCLSLYLLYRLSLQLLLYLHLVFFIYVWFLLYCIIISILYQYCFLFIVYISYIYNIIYLGRNILVKQLTNLFYYLYYLPLLISLPKYIAPQSSFEERAELVGQKNKEVGVPLPGKNHNVEFSPERPPRPLKKKQCHNPPQ